MSCYSLEDRIQRYGGLTGPSLPWPLEEKKKSRRQDWALKPQHANVKTEMVDLYGIYDDLCGILDFQVFEVFQTWVWWFFHNGWG